MTERTKSYFDLEPVDNWIDYLRARLPYSFERISEVGSGQGRQYVLSKPYLLTGGFTDYHNFWRRGNIYYVVGKLIEKHDLSRIWREYRKLEAQRLQWHDQQDGSHASAVTTPSAFYNSMQMEKLWEFCQQDILDRKRVVMTNISHATELCLKSIKAHAGYRENGAFTFYAGYDLNGVYNSLPQQLRDEIEAESKVFARQYTEFRTQVEQEVAALDKDAADAQGTDGPRYQKNWQRISQRIEQSSYTAIINSEDPGGVEGPEGNVGYVQEDWLELALTEVRDNVHHHSAPYRDKEAYPVGPIYWGLMLARFLYEHLFPVPLDRKEREPINYRLDAELTDPE